MSLRALSLIADLQLALMLLTRLPAGHLAQAGDPPPLARAVWAYPIVGALVGAMGAGVLVGAATLGLAPSIAATLALAVCILATGGLHEDGLADVADGFGGGQDRARKLEIMRDSRIGSYGTLALILSLALRVQILAAFAGTAQSVGRFWP
ncbi:MAG: adenosylcobinamide-GDP ribazoletransferase [Cypionkella sp.]|nr:adenosylcobinamide-GDP ribazoletransferase [Cypionkella sp.]